MKRYQKRAFALLLALCLTGALPIHVFAEIAPPGDVTWPVEAGGVSGANAAWYARAVYDLYYTGICWDIMDGENIVPDRAMTREEFITLLRGLAWYTSKLDDAPESQSAPEQVILYMDAVGDRPVIYRDALDWAVQNHILYGDGDSLSADRPMTRQEMAVILMRFAEYVGLELPQKSDAELDWVFCDAGRISPWAREAVEAAVQAGLIHGIVPYMAPQDTVTRAQGYQAVWNYTQAAGIYLMWRNEFVDWQRWSPF